MTETGNALTIARTIPSTVQQSWEAWTNPAILAGWWWPERFQTVFEIDLRPEGRYRYYTPDVEDVPKLAVSGRYLMVQKPSRLEYTWCWENMDEPETRVMVEFATEAGATEIRLNHSGFATGEQRENHIAGWHSCLDRLASLMQDSTA